MRFAGRLSLFLALACPGLWPGGLSAGETRDLLRNPGEGAEITASAWLTAVPDQGCFPIRLSARNDAPAARQWEVKAAAQSGYRDVTLQSQTSLRADARSASLREFMIPVTAGRQGNAPSVTLSVTGPGSDGSAASWNSGRWGDRSEFVAMAESLAVLGWGPLEKWLEKPPAPTSSRNLAGCKITPAGAPADWRGYSGLGSLWITLEDWDAWPAPAKPALWQWLAQGGRLCVVGKDLSPQRLAASGLPGPEDNLIRHGFGQIRLVPWNGTLLDAETAGRIISTSDAAACAGRPADYTTAWPLVSRLGPVAVNVPFVMVFVIGFAILVAPVNLFIFARRGRRHRMFWTTPLISLAASALLAVVIILQDGFGGTGSRLILASFQPEQKTVALVQEQAARTGVLLRSRFSVPEPVIMNPVYVGTGASGRARAYTESGPNRDGDWFSSRAAQGHLLRAVRPTRGAVEFIPGRDGAAPGIVSNLEFDLSQLYVQDVDGTVWQASSVRPGERKTLSRAPHTALADWRAAAQPGGSAIRALLDRVGTPRLHFFGIAADPSRLAVPTLSSIRWTEQTALCFGPLTLRVP